MRDLEKWGGERRNSHQHTYRRKEREEVIPTVTSTRARPIVQTERKGGLELFISRRPANLAKGVSTRRTEI